MTRLSTFFVLLLGVVLVGCRGTVSDSPPMHINPNMDFQEKFDPQEAIDRSVFADGRAMRPLVAGTIARGFLREDTRFYEGKEADGTFVQTAPVPYSADVIRRGQERYDIFCGPCHGGAGDGNGTIMQGYGYVPAPTYHSEALRAQSDGYMYEVITKGVRTMPGYAGQIPVADRWAIVTYIRALQRSQNASQSDFQATN